MSDAFEALGTKVTLAKSTDWYPWEDLFLRHAKSLLVYKYIDKATTLSPVEPTKLKLTEQLAKLKESKGDETITLEDLTWLKFEVEQSDKEYRAWWQERQAYSKLERWVFETVDPAYVRVISRDATLREIYVQLQERFGISDSSRTEEARAAYKKALVTTKRIKPDDWFNQWERAYLEGTRMKIPDLEGTLAITEFLEAAVTIDAEWARAKLRTLREQQYEKSVTMTLLGVSRLFQQVCRDNAKNKTLTSPAAFSTGTPQDNKGHECACGFNKKNHSWKPVDCAAWEIAVNGKSSRHAVDSRVAKCREAMPLPRWKSVVEAVRAKAKDSSGDASNEAPWPSAHMVLDHSAEDTQAAFSTMPQVHPLRDSTLYDNCASTHIINSRELLTRDVVPAGTLDDVLVGDTAIQVQFRGTRVMKGLLNGPDGPGTRDLVLKNVAFIPGFHTNLISGDKLRKEGYWHCGLDNTIRFGTMERNRILLKMSKTPAQEGSPHEGRRDLPNLALTSHSSDTFVRGMRAHGCSSISVIKIFIDIFSFEEGYNGHNFILLAADEFSGMFFCWSMARKSNALDILIDFEARIRRHCGVLINAFKLDNERALVNLEDQQVSPFQAWASDEGIMLELPPPHTKEPTGGAERPGGIIQQRVRTVMGKLPRNLWPEAYQALTYTHNLLPSERNGWRDPRQVLDEWFNRHLRIYAFGCRAYPLHKDHKANLHKKAFKINPRAHIGYLVGYHARNIYRIWVPQLQRVILSRDVRFNEELFFDPATEDLTIPIREYLPFAEAVELPLQRADESVLADFLEEFDNNVLDVDGDENSGGSDDTFNPTSRDPTTACEQRSQPHRDTLIRLPKRYQDLDHHPHGKEFKEGCRNELRDLIRRGTWRLIHRMKATSTPIPLKWVFDYKFDSNGFLVRCKARICVRGDLQEKSLHERTYAATLAAKTFRTVMAVAAKRDLDVRQFDVANAFLNTKINKDLRRVFVELPKGYVELGFLKPGEIVTMVAELNKALYGLRESPLLWYNEIAQVLEQQGLKRTAEEPCVFTNGVVLILVYVDDILLLSPRGTYTEDIATYLRSRYELREEAFGWYLGIRVIRDRDLRKIWLCQDAYIEKIARRFNLADLTRTPAFPLPLQRLRKHDGEATPGEIKSFQEKVGSIMYTAVTARPDVAFAASQLARHLLNPSPQHHDAADQCIQYLYSTRFLAIEFDGLAPAEALVIASDASFADDEETRCSSQGYVMMLYGGPVVWKASLQDTVTTSTTEAELLGLEKTVKESIALERLLQNIDLDLGPLKLYCDNLQTIRLVVDEGFRISTKLRHVDIQGMWLKQEFRRGRFLVEYLPTDLMPADGFTKALTRGKFEKFRAALNMTDIRDRLG
ncbi:reverse transcriptase (RNA-dependent DNA polymerase) [Hirsutella rhossiliensis]|uniref:Reverse transcriptase (RNA-dependent DNA polymerase) domain-containing protein n=1 Tax=Hirsutella rhossiliensis TaxID=111463 RepID=A0A9P8MPZ0_9HYPO|nr:reverse transcriptase (RNA-dependent DNA polymerase) domain-containing protein [Hirsutella rhossiliensis]KAH0959297.1 reverse transcriptase (RNA-dependent DNA polymerase) domain-containing protein [Hirsutella rhossiliensis]